MLRHIGATTGRSKSPEARSSPGRVKSSDETVHTEGSISSSQQIYKKTKLTLKQRNHLRSSMLGFLETTRGEEEELVSA